MPENSLFMQQLTSSARKLHVYGLAGQTTFTDGIDLLREPPFISEHLLEIEEGPLTTFFKIIKDVTIERCHEHLSPDEIHAFFPRIEFWNTNRYNAQKNEDESALFILDYQQAVLAISIGEFSKRLKEGQSPFDDAWFRLSEEFVVVLSEYIIDTNIKSIYGPLLNISNNPNGLDLYIRAGSN